MCRLPAVFGFKLHQNFYCCRFGYFSNAITVSNYIKISTVVDRISLRIISNVSNYIKISTVVDLRAHKVLQGFKLHQNFYCCRCARLCCLFLRFKLHQNFYCCRSELAGAALAVSNYIKISTVVDITTSLFRECFKLHQNFYCCR